MTLVLVRHRRDRKSPEEEAHGKTEAEIGITLPQAREHLEA
jgi:hypothetical protein